MWHTLGGIVGLVLLVTVATAEQMYKCPDGTGGSVFRNRPCAGTVLAPAPAPAPAPEGPSESDWAVLCQEAGRSAYEIATARDRGITSDHLIALMRQRVRDPVHAALLSEYQAVILELYTKPYITPTGAQDGVEIKCLSEHAQP